MEGAAAPAEELFSVVCALSSVVAGLFVLAVDIGGVSCVVEEVVGELELRLVGKLWVVVVVGGGVVVVGDDGGVVVGPAVDGRIEVQGGDVVVVDVGGVVNVAAGITW